MWKPGIPTANDWAASTSSLPITFAQVREDPRIEGRLIAELNRPARVLMVASGGDTAAFLATLPLQSLHLVDANAAHIALANLKLSMLTDASTEDRLGLLGHYGIKATERYDELRRRMDETEYCIDDLGPPALIAEFGPDHCGRNEWVFARLREHLRPHQHAIRHLLSQSHVQEQARSVADNTQLGIAISDACQCVMAAPNLQTVFGCELTTHHAIPFCQHFLRQTREAFARFPACENPFLHQLLLGHFAGPLWDWLESARQPELCAIRSDITPMEKLIETLPDQSYDLIHLSNTVDCLAVDQVELMLAQAYRCLAPGGMVVVRQLNRELDLASYELSLDWDRDLAEELHHNDRSFIYRSLHIGSRH